MSEQTNMINMTSFANFDFFDKQSEIPASDQASSESKAKEFGDLFTNFIAAPVVNTPVQPNPELNFEAIKISPEPAALKEIAPIENQFVETLNLATPLQNNNVSNEINFELPLVEKNLSGDSLPKTPVKSVADTLSEKVVAPLSSIVNQTPDNLDSNIAKPEFIVNPGKQTPSETILSPENSLFAFEKNPSSETNTQPKVLFEKLIQPESNVFEVKPTLEQTENSIADSKNSIADFDLVDTVNVMPVETKPIIHEEVVDAPVTLNANSVVEKEGFEIIENQIADIKGKVVPEVKNNAVFEVVNKTIFEGTENEVLTAKEDAVFVINEIVDFDNEENALPEIKEQVAFDIKERVVFEVEEKVAFEVEEYRIPEESETVKANSGTTGISAPEKKAFTVTNELAFDSVENINLNLSPETTDLSSEKQINANGEIKLKSETEFQIKQHFEPAKEKDFEIKSEMQSKQAIFDGLKATIENDLETPAVIKASPSLVNSELLSEVELQTPIFAEQKATASIEPSSVTLENTVLGTPVNLKSVTPTDIKLNLSPDEKIKTPAETELNTPIKVGFKAPVENELKPLEDQLKAPAEIELKPTTDAGLKPENESFVKSLTAENSPVSTEKLPSRETRKLADLLNDVQESVKTQQTKSQPAVKPANDVIGSGDANFEQARQSSDVLPVIQTPTRKFQKNIIQSPIKLETLSSVANIPGKFKNLINLSNPNTNDPTPVSLSPVASGTTPAQVNSAETENLAANDLPTLFSKILNSPDENINTASETKVFAPAVDLQIKGEQTNNQEKQLTKLANNLVPLSETADSETPIKLTDNSPAPFFERLTAAVKNGTQVAESAPALDVRKTEILEQIEKPLLQAAILNAETDKPEILKLRLRPAELGMVEVRLEKTDANTIKIQFQTETDATKQILADNFNQLKTTLENSGWRVEPMEIVSNQFTPGQFTSSGSEQREQQSQQAVVENKLKEQTSLGSDADETGDLQEKNANRLLSVRA